LGDRNTLPTEHRREQLRRAEKRVVERPKPDDAGDHPDTARKPCRYGREESRTLSLGTMQPPSVDSMASQLPTKSVAIYVYGQHMKYGRSAHRSGETRRERRRRRTPPQYIRRVSRRRQLRRLSRERRQRQYRNQQATPSRTHLH